MQPLKLAIVIGTRPEAVKLAPVVRLAHARHAVFAPIVISTSQHREMLVQMFAAFGIHADVDLQLMKPGQGLTDFAAAALLALADCFARLRPDVVLVQGDTTTVVAAALAAFHQRLVVGHVEAGLRSFDRYDPFPEEANRRLTATLATYHFAPTPGARRNLLREHIPAAAIYVTGNTVVDALQLIRLDERFDDPTLRTLPLAGQRLLLVTAHRRENHGAPLRHICAALRRLVRAFPDVRVVFPVHLHPAVRGTVFAALAQESRIHLVEPVGYADLLRLLRRACLVLTDSGGIQEEAPSFRKPVLVLRRTTERPELVAAGGAQLVGTGTANIVAAASRLLTDPAAYNRMCLDYNPFGDGCAAAIILDTLTRLHASPGSGAGHPPPPTRPAATSRRPRLPARRAGGEGKSRGNPCMAAAERPRQYQEQQPGDAAAPPGG